MRKSVKLSTDTRDELKRVHLGKTHERTISHLAGRWTRLRCPPATEKPPRNTVIKLSEAGHRFLMTLKEDMGASALGDVIATLIECKRR